MLLKNLIIAIYNKKKKKNYFANLMISNYPPVHIFKITFDFKINKTLHNCEADFLFDSRGIIKSFLLEEREKNDFLFFINITYTLLIYGAAQQLVSHFSYRDGMRF
jgi:hypothetical protein